jgi:hypothetical protein
VLAVRASVPELLRPRAPGARSTVGRALDDYIEAQVHGPIDLARDVEGLVIDPAHDRTDVGEGLRALGERYGIAVERHPGFELAPHEVPSDFRGPRMPALAERVASSNALATSVIDARTIGRAAASLYRDPAAWQDWATPDETLQHLKQLWHVLVRFGHPATLPPPPSPRRP